MCSLASLINQASFKAALHFDSEYVNEQIICAVISILRKNVGLALGKYDCFILKQGILFGSQGMDVAYTLLIKQHIQKKCRVLLSSQMMKAKSRINSAPLTRCQTIRVCVFSP